MALRIKIQEDVALLTVEDATQLDEALGRRERISAERKKQKPKALSAILRANERRGSLIEPWSKRHSQFRLVAECRSPWNPSGFQQRKFKRGPYRSWFPKCLWISE